MSEYAVETRSTTPKNFFAGEFPTVPETGTAGAVIAEYTPVTTDGDGKIVPIAAGTKEASIVVFSPPAIQGMSMMGGFEFQMLAKGDYTPQELEQWANKLIGEANAEAGYLSNVNTSFQANVPQYTLEIDFCY